jgi:heme-degrading monooxygenase HmoA
MHSVATFAARDRQLRILDRCTVEESDCLDPEVKLLLQPLGEYVLARVLVAYKLRAKEATIAGVNAVVYWSKRSWRLPLRIFRHGNLSPANALIQVRFKREAKIELCEIGFSGQPSTSITDAKTEAASGARGPHDHSHLSNWSCESDLDKVPGFVEFHLLKGPEAEDHTLYASHTIWENRAVFEAWTKSEAFRAAHSRAGDNKPLYLDHPQFEGFEVRQTVRRSKAGQLDT